MKKYFMFLGLISLIAIIGLTTDCQNQAEKEELEKYRAQAKIEEQNKTLVKNLMDGFNRKDSTVYEIYYAPNCVFYFPSAKLKPSTNLEDKEALMSLWRAFPDIQWRIEEMIAKENMVATRFSVKGTQKETWIGIPSTEKKFEASGIFITRIENGKIVEHREDADLFGMVMQLGMELKPTKGKK